MANTSLHQVNQIEEATANAGVTIRSRRTGIPPTLKADGATDDGPALVALQNAAYASGDVLELGPTGALTYYLNSTVAISCHLRPLRGAIIELGPSANLTITGPFDPGWYKVFKFSGGSLSFTGNTSIDYYKIKWWGVVGDGATDDTVAWQKWALTIPEWSETRCAAGMVMNVSGNILVFNKWGIILKGGKRGVGDPGEKSVQFNYTATGGDLLSLNRCSYGLMQGFVINMNNGDAAIVMDMTSAGRIGTQFELSKLWINLSGTRSTSGGVSISPTSASNEEYHLLRQVTVMAADTLTEVFGNPGYNASITATTTAGSNAVVTANPVLFTQQGNRALNSSDVGRRIRLGRCATAVTGPDGGNGQLDTTIASVTDSTHFTVAAAGAGIGAVSGTSFLIGYQLGYGVAIGPSFNAKAIKLEDCAFNGLETGLQLNGGSYINGRSSFSGCEKAITRGANCSEPSWEFFANTEKCRQFLVCADNGMPHGMSGRFSLQWIAPSKGFFEFSSTATVFEMRIFTIDDFPPIGAYLFDTRNASALRMQLSGARTVSFTKAMSGLSNKNDNCVIEVENWSDSGGSDMNIDYEMFGKTSDSSKPLRYHHGKEFYRVPQAQPAVGDFRSVAGVFSPYIDNNGGYHDLRFDASYGSGGFAVETHVVPKITKGFTNWTPGLVANGAQVTKTVTVTGAVRFNFAGHASVVLAGIQSDLQGCQLTAYVSAANTVTVVLQNNTGAGITFGADELAAMVIQY